MPGIATRLIRDEAGNLVRVPAWQQAPARRLSSRVTATQNPRETTGEAAARPEQTGRLSLFFRRISR